MPFFAIAGKSLLIFLVLIVLARLDGRKLLAKISYFDFAVTITIGSISATYVAQGVDGAWVLASPVILTGLTVLLDYAHMKSLRLRKLAEGEPVIIIQKGKILEKNMRRLRYNLDILEAQLRDKGIFDFSEVEYAILEPLGRLSVLKKSEVLPLTPQDMNQKPEPTGLSTELIKDGKLLDQNLKERKLTRSWVIDELKKQGAERPEDVFYASVNARNQLYVSLKEIQPDPSDKIEE